MFLLIFLFVSISTSFSVELEPEFGSFWHFTDLELDENFTAGASLASDCHSKVSQNDPNVTQFGAFGCFSPKSLIRSALENAQKIQPKPDFIIWSGSSIAQTPNNCDNSLEFFECFSDSNLAKLYIT